ncbi:MAG: GNAT family N-acetyltransferase, partial [Bacteroidota bacterium]
MQERESLWHIPFKEAHPNSEEIQVGAYNGLIVDKASQALPKSIHPPILKTNRFTLMPYRQEDEDRFVEIALDETSTQFMGGATGNEEEERALFKQVLELYKKKDQRWFWVWGIYEEDLLCGHIELKESEHTNEHELEIVYMIHPEQRRKGVMTEVLALLKQKQKSLGKRIIATVSPDNSSSFSLLEKWGIE